VSVDPAPSSLVEYARTRQSALEASSVRFTSSSSLCDISSSLECLPSLGSELRLRSMIMANYAFASRITMASRYDSSPLTRTNPRTGLICPRTWARNLDENRKRKIARIPIPLLI
ncbi:hypothetical protein OC845_006941, partial [Tilletia horrida]